MTHAVVPDLPGPLPDLLDHVADGPVVRLRTTGPSAGGEAWLVTDYHLGRIVLTDRRFSRAAAARPDAPKLNTANPAPSSMVSLDGTEHARLRHLVAGAFSPRRTTQWTPLVERLTCELLDDLDDSAPPADLIASFAAPLPLAVLCRLLGVPAQDRPVFQSSVGVLFDVSASTPREKARRAFALYDYMSALIERKRREPADDLLCALIDGHRDGRLSHRELIDLCLAMLMAGYETTVGQLGLSVLAILRDPALREQVHDGTGGAAVVEEQLRLTPATPLSFPRVAVEDVRLGGVTVEAGQAVVVSLLHGNRDDKVFTDAQTVQRRSVPHLTFGHGAHYCLGAPLARLQVRVAVEALFHRFPRLRLAAGPDAVRWHDGLATRGLSRLMVAW